MVTLTGEASLIHTIHDRPPLDVDAVIKAITVIQKESDNQSPFVESAEVRINTHSPVLLVTMGDMHIGNQATDHAKILEHLKIVRDTPNTFITFMGDEVDNLYVFRKGGAEETMSAEMQGLLVGQMVGELVKAGKVISMVSGNHTMFSDNFYRAFLEKQVPIFYNWGQVKLSIGSQEYKFAQFHEFTMGNSTMSHLLRELKVLEMRFPDAEIVAGAHTHRKAVEEVNINGKRRVLMETGTYKIKDGFQIGHGNARFGQFDFGGASVLLFPDTKRIIPFYDLEMGIEAVTGKLFLKQALMQGASNVLRK